MKIAIVCAESMADGYAPFAHVQGLAVALREAGHDVAIVGKDSGPYHDAGITGRIARYILVNWRAAKALGKSDVMLARGHFAHLPWTALAYLRGVPVVHEMNGMMLDAATTYRWLKFVQWVINTSYRRQFAMAAGISCVTAEIAEHVKARRSGTLVRVIGNGVDPEIFAPKAGEQQTQRFAIFPSALAPWHGVSTLLEAASNPAWPLDLELVVVGDGAQADLVSEVSSRDKRVRYVGHLPRAELAVLLRKASIGLCLVESLEKRGMTEVYPLKLFEMMASGLPIIATDQPGQREIVREAGAGLIVPQKDPVALARAVAELYGRGDRKAMGLAGAAAASAKHSWRVRSAELESFLSEAVPGPAGKSSSGTR